MPEEDQNPHLEEYLKRHELLPITTPFPIEGRDRLQHLVAADIPLNSTTIGETLNEFIVTGDLAGVQYLHDEGEGHELLVLTTLYLFHQILEIQEPGERKLWRKQTSLDQFKKLVSKDLLERVIENRKNFCNEIISGYISHMPFTNLRGMLKAGILDMDEEQEIEEWLMKSCDLDEKDKKSLRNDRELLQLSLREKEPDFVVDTTNPDYIKKKIEELCKNDNTDEAFEILEKLPLVDQPLFGWYIARRLIELDKSDDALHILNTLRNKILDPEYPEKTKVGAFTNLIDLHIKLVDTDGLKTCFENINPENYIQICSDLGVTKDEFIKLFLLYYYEIDYLNGEAFFTRKFDSSKFDDLFSRKYLRENLINKEGRSNYDGNIFITLLAERILHFGEDGINFPPSYMYQKSYDIALYLTVNFALVNDYSNYIIWLNRLYNIPTSMGGNNNIKNAFDIIEARQHKKKKDQV